MIPPPARPGRYDPPPHRRPVMGYSRLS